MRCFFITLCLLFLGQAVACAQQSEKEDSIFFVVDSFPYIFDCQGEITNQSRQNCSFVKLKSFIAENINFPLNGQCIEGTVYARFTIFKDGSVGNFTILKNSTGHVFFEQDTARIFETIQSKFQWHPGINNGKIVNTHMVIPFRYKYL